jgi:hypothetical protein
LDDVGFTPLTIDMSIWWSGSLYHLSLFHFFVSSELLFSLNFVFFQKTDLIFNCHVLKLLNLSNFLAVIVFWNVIFKKLFFRFFLCLFVIKKIVWWKILSDQQETFSDQLKIYRKMFFFFLRKTLSRSCEKFKNVILFTDIYIYIVLNICFSISSLRI